MKEDVLVTKQWLRVWSLVRAATQHQYASGTRQYNLVPAKMQWCFSAGKMTAGLVESNGSRPTASVICGLTTHGRDQLRNPALLSSITLYLYKFIIPAVTSNLW